jgi:hypothetical protein
MSKGLTRKGRIMLGNEIMFYNGFNLFIDLIIAGVVGFSVYRWASGRAWIEGYGAGCSDTEEYQQDQASDYMWETYREQRDALNEIDRDVQELKKLADQFDKM